MFLGWMLIKAATSIFQIEGWKMFLIGNLAEIDKDDASFFWTE